MCCSSAWISFLSFRYNFNLNASLFTLQPVSKTYLIFVRNILNMFVFVGNFLSTSLLQGGFDVSQMHALSSEASRVKSVGLQSLSQLIALVELLNTSLFQEKTLLILEGVQLILVAQKVTIILYYIIFLFFCYSELLFAIANRWSDILFIEYRFAVRCTSTIAP